MKILEINKAQLEALRNADEDGGMTLSDVIELIEECEARGNTDIEFDSDLITAFENDELYAVLGE